MGKQRYMSASDAAAMRPDYVVVGAGPGGCVMASRLTEDPGTKVLLVEAGRDNDDLRIKLPSGVAAMVTRPQFDWNWQPLPDPSINGRSLIWSSGKMLGGSSSIHGQVHMRGLKSDFDLWARSLGDESGEWSYDDLLPYFVKSENYTGTPSPARGRGGPLNVVEIREPHPLAKGFVRAGVDLGYEATDHNGDQPMGYAITQGTQKDGRRFSAFDGYITPHLNRPNLGVIIKHQATRILFDGTRAVGVELTSPDGTRTRIEAAREVIVSSGTVGTTNLLMKSGVGPGQMLQDAGVALRVESAGLGSNLQEHPGFSVSRLVKDAWSLNQAFARPDIAARWAYQLLRKRKGPFTDPAVIAMGYAHTTPDRTLPPELQLHFMPFAYRLKPESKGPLTGELAKRAAVGMMASHAKPKARGTISITDADPFAAPVIDHKLLGDERDLRDMVAGAKIITEMFKSPHLAPHVIGQFNPEVTPTDETGWVEYVRGNTYAAYHMCGTARMGRRDDPTAVVDPTLRVIGAENLRVVDASVMPHIPSSNTFVPTIAIGEKAADLVRSGA